MRRTTAGAMMCLLFCGCQAINLPDVAHEDVRTSVYDLAPPVAPQYAQDDATGTPDAEGDIDTGEPFFALRRALGLP